ncbi:MAG: prephenate dehydratase domain-containing protein [Thermodesulfobacteriota bacterium]
MITIATVGPTGSHTWQAAHRHDPRAEIRLFPHLAAVFAAYSAGEADLAVAPVYNAREGQIKEFSRLIRTVADCHWQGNLVFSIHLSLGCLSQDGVIRTIVGRAGVLRQCEDYLAATFPEATVMAVHDLDAMVAEIQELGRTDHGVIESEEALRAYGLVVREREIVPHNLTRYAVLGRTPAPRTGYDATALITSPIKDRVGILVDLLSEFAKRSINVLDIQTEADPKSQKLLFSIELEGHQEDQRIREALARIEKHVIQEPGSIRVLGSFPRVDMRAKHIKKIGFIGSGDMSLWFADRLRGEGYETVVTGRSTAVRPEEMVPEVDVVAVCVPISATPSTIRQYGPLLHDKQCLLLLAGEAEHVLDTALAHTSEGVEVLLVHNLWGPAAATMKDKNVSVVRTIRSGILSSEIEAFLYKHGAHISLDAPEQHDLMMGVSQKLPSAMAMALAMALMDNRIDPAEIGGHSTLTSLYSILSMARIHAQNPRTYGEILATRGEGRRLVRSFAENLGKVIELAEAEDIEALCALITASREYLGEKFLADRMRQSLAVDDTLGRMLDND